MNDHSTEDSNSSLSGSSPGGEGLLWRAWPCSSCRQVVNPIRELIGSQGADSELLSGLREEVSKSQAAVLLRWTESCSHTTWQPFLFPEIAQGSEHAVYLEEGSSQIFKITLPGTYGDFYYLVNDKVHQEKCTPLEYLVRLHLWKKLFRVSPSTIGMTKLGNIVSKQDFITGEPPTQKEVDLFLRESGLIPVKANCFIWKKEKVYSGLEIWIGDTRDENFVKTESGIVPIDIRLWFA
jgi:hypothetical protein